MKNSRIRGCFKSSRQLLSLFIILLWIPFQGLHASPDEWSALIVEDPAEEIWMVSAMACKPSVQVSLDQSGMATVLPAMLVTGPEYGWSEYEVDIMGPLNDIVSCDQIGQEIMAVVEELPTGNTCMTTLVVQDKLPPLLVCSGDFLSCSVQVDTIQFVNYINVLDDNCDTELDLFYTFSITNVPCNPENITAYINVNWTATDDYNNFTTCSDTIFLIKPEIDDVVFPADTAVSCEDPDVSPEVIGGPTANGEPIDHTCKLISWHEDYEVPMCSGMTKIIRTWYVMDWCTGEQRSDFQEILIEDNTPPEVICQQDQDISTLPLFCYALYTLPDPVSVTDACSDPDSIELRIKISSMPGIFFPGETVQLDLGPHTITYEVFDDCLNEGTCSFTVNVVDDVQPTQVCSHLNVGVGANGVSTILADTLDFHPFDNCGVEKVELSRLAPECSNPSNEPFDESITVCCDDVGETIMAAYKVTDVNGNMNSCMFTITVKDALPPIAECRDVTLAINTEIPVSVSAADIDNGSNDNCEIASLEVSPNAFDCDDLGIQQVTLTVTDGSGNTASCDASITLIDTLPPIAVCSNLVRELMPDGTVSIETFEVDGGTLDNCFLDTVYISKYDFDCDDLGVNIVILTAKDESGNVDTCQSAVTILEIPPVANCRDITVGLDENGMAMIDASDVNDNSMDECEIASISVDPAEFECSDFGINTVILTVVDFSGLSDTCSAQVQVKDLLPPVCRTKDITVFLDEQGIVDIMSSDIDNGSSDNCTEIILMAEPMSFDCDDIGDNTVDLTVTDIMGNMTTCSATVTVKDTISPDCNAAGISIFLDETGIANITENDIDNSSIDNCSISDLSVDPNRFDCSEAGTDVQVTLTVTDIAGNITTCTANVSVMDTIPPDAQCVDPIVLPLDQDGNASIGVDDIDNNSTDNCPIMSRTIDVNTFDCTDAGDNIVTLTVTDESGNVSTCSTTVTVVDNIPPVAVCQDITVMLDENGSATITAQAVDGGTTDNCSFTLTASPLTFGCADVGNQPVTLTATDPSGNTDNCIATVNVMENLLPMAVCQDVTVYLDGSGASSITAADVDGGSGDNCGNVELSVDPSAFDCGDTGNNPVILTVTDQVGNVTTCDAVVTVLDTIPPTAVCATDFVLPLDNDGNASITVDQIDDQSTDNCPIVSRTIDVNAFGCSDIGPNVVILTVTDESGNVSTCSTTVSVTDNIAPVAVCQDITVMLDGNGMATITPQAVDGGTTDNCSFTLTATPLTFGCDMVGDQVVTLTATDPSGNTDDCVATVNVMENQMPVAVCQDVTVYLDGSGTASITAAEVDGGSGDNCGNVNLSVDPSAFDCTDIGNNPVVLTVTDNVGNMTTCEAVVTVLDTTPPVAICVPGFVLPLDGNGMAAITVNNIDNMSFDNCPGFTTAIDLSSFDCASTGPNEVTLTVVDGSGNDATCTTTVNVVDNMNPVAVCADITVSIGANAMVTITPPDVDGGSTDNCAFTLSASPLTFDCDNLGLNAVELVVTDESGNTGACMATVTVVEELDLMAVCTNIQVELGANGMVSITPQDVDGGSSSTCQAPDLSIDVAEFDCGDVGPNQVILTVTSGIQMEACTATVTVVDNILPSAICQNITVDLDAAGNASIMAGDVDNGSSDNCPFNLVIDISSFDCSNVGANNVTLTATDQSNNVASCVAVVTVRDVTAPTCLAQDITISLDGNGNAMITVNDINNGSSDNCPGITFGLTPTNFTCDNLGDNLVTLTVTDASSNSTACQATVTVIDETALVANCQNITVFLDQNGQVSITPDQIDTGSGGGCTGSNVDLTLDISNFDCGDIGPNNVTLTVSDQMGMTASCVGIVTCVDNLPPQITCPANVQLNCNDEINLGDLSQFGTATAEDNCATPVISESVDIDLDNCGAGTVTRTFSATDNTNPAATCIQTITILNSDPFGADDIVFPPAVIELTGCASTDPDDIPNGSPVIDLEPTSCAAVSVTYEDTDPEFTVDNDPNTACVSFTRTWTISDTCQLEPGTDNGIFVFVQTISVNDFTPPAFNFQPDVNLVATPGNCEVLVNLVASANDCSNITYTNDSPFANTGGADASGNYPFGTTIVTFTATDECGNIGTQEVSVTITEQSPPSFQCLKIVRELPPELEITIHAVEFISFTSGTCSELTDFYFSYSADDPFDSLRTFSCDNVGEMTMPLWFYDLNLMKVDSCNTADLELDDVDDSCGDGFTIEGEVESEEGFAINDTEVMIEEMAMDPVMTTDNGNYFIEGLLNTGGYTVKPSRDYNDLEGVSTLDLVGIQKHLLGISPLTSPYKMIAADVNRSGRITGLDLLELRKLLLGIYDAFPDNESWRFVEADYSFPDPYNPFMTEFPESVYLDTLSQESTQLNFIGMKVGDVNGSYFTLQEKKVITRSAPAHLLLEDRIAESDAIELPVYFNELPSAIGFQFKLDIDGRFVGSWEVTGLDARISMEDLYLSGDQLSVVWNDVENLEWDAQSPVFTIRLNGVQRGVRVSDMVSLTENSLQPEAYVDGGQYEVRPLSLVWQLKAGSEYALFQNIPNPFTHETVIGFSLPEPADVLIEVYTASGQMVWEQEGAFSSGKHQVALHDGTFPSAGVYYYTIRTEGFTATRKMIFQQ